MGGRLIGLAAGCLAVGLIAAPSAGATGEPFCNSSYAWARPGIERQYHIYCFNVDHAAVTRVPDHVTLSDFAFSGGRVTFRLIADASAAPSSFVDIAISGPGGQAQSGSDVRVVPLDQNTAPVCKPESLVKRTDGSKPAELVFPVSCEDAEHDDFTIQGGGPGTHPDAPVLVRPSMDEVSPSAWRYRTSASAGAEHTTYWATDQFGAASDAAAIDVEFGPAADHKPVCTPVPWGAFVADPLIVYLRPGATRLFAVRCDDADGDDFMPQLGTPPSRGTITAFDVTPAAVFSGGLSRAVYLEYTPASAFEGEDDFAITTTNDRGSTQTGIALITRTVEQDSGRLGGCGSSWTITGGSTVNAHAECYSPIGDPLAGVVTGGPEHGQAGAPVSSTLPSGDTAIDVPYTPDAGFAGTDHMTVHVTNPSGDGTDVQLEVEVFGHQELPSIFPPGTTYLDFLQDPSAPPTLPPDPPVAPQPIDAARAALGTDAVRLVRRVGPASIFAPRASLRAVAAQRAIAVACPALCEVAAASELRTGRHVRHHRVAFATNHGVARAVFLRLDSAERKRLRRLGSATAVFRVAVRSGHRTRVARIPLRIHVRR